MNDMAPRVEQEQGSDSNAFDFSHQQDHPTQSRGIPFGFAHRLTEWIFGPVIRFVAEKMKEGSQ